MILLQENSNLLRTVKFENLVSNAQANGQKSVLEVGYNRDFYERADLKDMYDYCLKIRKFHPKTSHDLVSYFKRFRDQFFTEKVEQIRILTPRMRSKIIEAFRKFW